MHSFEVSLGYENVDRSTFSMKRYSFEVSLGYELALIEAHFQHVLRSTLSYPNEISKECIPFLNK